MCIIGLLKNGILLIIIWYRSNYYLRDFVKKTYKIDDCSIKFRIFAA